MKKFSGRPAVDAEEKSPVAEPVEAIVQILGDNIALVSFLPSLAVDAAGIVSDAHGQIDPPPALTLQMENLSVASTAGAILKSIIMRSALH
jgi:hypothetical protein